MKKQLQAIIMLWFCILMQTVSVFPHHHHCGVPCIGHAMEASCPSQGAHRCTSDCITHFNLTLPSSESARQERKVTSDTQDILKAIYGLSIIYYTETSETVPFFDWNIFFQSRSVGATGLRAPPCYA